nr:MAG TPA: hypothetical protein [Caudoviricetes sp.]
MTVGQLKKELAKYSDDTPVLFGCDMEDEFAETIEDDTITIDYGIGYRNCRIVRIC